MTPKSRKMRTRVCSGCGASKVIRADNRSEICRRCATKKQHDSKPSNLKHGFCGTNLWNVWMGMKYRCDASGSPDYPKYGGRGIKVCDKWHDDFQAFQADMGDKKKGDHIHRVDNNKGYSPENCIWISAGRHTRLHNLEEARAKASALSTLSLESSNDNS